MIHDEHLPRVTDDDDEVLYNLEPSSSLQLPSRRKNLLHPRAE